MQQQDDGEDEQLLWALSESQRLHELEEMQLQEALRLSTLLTESSPDVQRTPSTRSVIDVSDRGPATSVVLPPLSATAAGGLNHQRPPSATEGNDDEGIADTSDNDEDEQEQKEEDDDDDDEDEDDEDEIGPYGFTHEEEMELLSQGVKPWEDDAHAVLDALRGDY